MVEVPANNWRAAAVARRNGCQPHYWEPYDAFCCGCADLLHACDQQCSAISDASAARRREH